VVAYYCLMAGQVERGLMPGRLRRNKPAVLPVFVLGRLAIDRSWQGRGLGQDLAAHALRQCLAAAELIGARAVLVHPLYARLSPFYARLGFERLPFSELAMFIPIETIAAAFAAT
jgi:predicted N-acetyltransferase YhbS